MNEQNKVTGRSVRSLRTVIVLAVCVFALALSAMAQTPTAGTKIGNQASATYTDASNVARTATSNSVFTVVQQVASLQLTADGAKTGTPGTQVAYPHTLVNTGNGTDTFNLAATNATGKDFTHNSVAIYADANGDGIPDNNTPVTSISIAPGAANAFKFVVVGTVPTNALAGQKGTITVTATSVFNSGASNTNNDTTTVTGNAVIAVTKSLSQNSGTAGSTGYTVTLTYTNNGNATATNVTFTDALATGFNYHSGQGHWSGTGATVLTDATGDTQGTGTTIDYSVTGSTVTAIVNSIAPGVSGTITFQVDIASNAAPGVLANSANFSYNDGGSGGGATVNGTTNTVNFTVLQTAGVTITAVGGGNTATVASAPQGATVSFTSVVTNTGNGTDTFNITIPSNTFPAGTTFALFKSDGVTPLIDTNGDGTPDSGPMATAGTYNVIVKATLPAGTAGGGAYTANVTATSTFKNTVTASMTDQLTTITANTVDVQTGTGTGSGKGPEASAVDTLSTNPGTTATFVLKVVNTSTVADSFDLSLANSLPAGWTLTFRSSSGVDCSAANIGGLITNTGVINGAASAPFASKVVCAVVTVPAGFAAGTYDLNFKANSPTSNAFDTLHDALTVLLLHAVSLTPNNSGQIFPNGSVVYKHTLTNSGNATESVALANVDTASGWSSIVYQDNTTGTVGSFDAADTAVTGAITVTPNTSVILFVKVNAPAGAAIGAVDTTTTTATYSTLTTSAQDGSTVIAGQLRLQKDQALDASCSASYATLTFSQSDISAGAAPGACVVYRITAINDGTAPVTQVVISDATPAYTTYSGTATVTTTSTDPVTVTPPSGSTGTVTADLGSGALAPGGNIVLTFRVKINP